MAGERTGLFGGSFNPPHLGHLVCAKQARHQLGLNRVIWMPVGVAPHRVIEEEVGPETRLEMCHMAVEGEEGLDVSDYEVKKNGPAYTVETLRHLSKGIDGEIFLILGGDQAASFSQWREPEEVLRLAQLAVAGRGDQERDEVRAALSGIEGGERAIFFDMPRVDISSTLVRQWVKQGLPIRKLVPDGVVRYIEEWELYAG